MSQGSAADRHTPSTQRSTRDVGIAGLGIVSALGCGVNEHVRALRDGRDGLRPIERFESAFARKHVGGVVPAFEHRRIHDGVDGDLALTWARMSCEEALAMAGVDASHGPIALVLGTGMGDQIAGAQMLGAHLARALGIDGPVIVLSSACTSSTAAFGVSMALLDDAQVNRVLVGGVDVLTEELLGGFAALGALSTGPCGPFGATVGTSLGEGAAFFVLERVDDLAKRGVASWATIRGTGSSADGHHATSPDPSGRGLGRCIQATLRDAGLEATDVDYVNAHGTGTIANDLAEWTALQLALGDHASAVPISSSKSFLGHAQGAAGAIEAAITVLALREGFVPPTLHVQTLRRFAPKDVVATPKPREAALQHALSISAGFGGSNAAVLISRERQPHRAVRRDGVSMIAVERIHAGHVGGRVAMAPLRAELGTIPIRTLDPTAIMLTAAVVRAQRTALTFLGDVSAERVGLFVAQSRVSPASAKWLESSIDEHGPSGPSAAAFARSVLNAPAGDCTRLLSLKGPSLCFAAGATGLPFVIAMAQSWLATRDDADVIVAASVDEAMSDDEPCPAEGATAVVLTRAHALRGRPTAATPRVLVVDYALTASRRIEETLKTLGSRGPTRFDTVVETTCGDDEPERPRANATHEALARLWSALHKPSTPSSHEAAWIVDDGRAMSIALHFQRLDTSA